MADYGNKSFQYDSNDSPTTKYIYMLLGLLVIHILIMLYYIYTIK